MLVWSHSHIFLWQNLAMPWFWPWPNFGLAQWLNLWYVLKTVDWKTWAFWIRIEPGKVEIVFCNVTSIINAHVELNQLYSLLSILLSVLLILDFLCWPASKIPLGSWSIFSLVSSAYQNHYYYRLSFIPLFSNSNYLLLVICMAQKGRAKHWSIAESTWVPRYLLMLLFILDLTCEKVCNLSKVSKTSGF